MDASHCNDEYFSIGTCGLCDKNNRYVEHGIDFFGVHVLDYCAYGCSNKKSKVDQDK
ncbi:hypothetical protein QCI47_29880 [Bacillus cereus group sp. RP29]|uniref:hypothetical protein n=1 Tax=Bacillus cereus group sp. RP29 TaxID=3040257 RepID=UPI0033951A5F